MRTKISILLALALVVVPGILLTQDKGAIVVTTVADIAGDGSSHAVAASGTARWVLFIAPTTNSNPVRVGDSSISGTRGVPIVPGGGFMLPPLPSAPKMNTEDQYYTLSSTYYLIQAGDKLSVVWGK